MKKSIKPNGFFHKYKGLGIFFVSALVFTLFLSLYYKGMEQNMIREVARSYREIVGDDLLVTDTTPKFSCYHNKFHDTCYATIDIDNRGDSSKVQTYFENAAKIEQRLKDKGWLAGYNREQELLDKKARLKEEHRFLPANDKWPGVEHALNDDGEEYYSSNIEGGKSTKLWNRPVSCDLKFSAYSGPIGRNPRVITTDAWHSLTCYYDKNFLLFF
jgi:hypothetical protein